MVAIAIAYTSGNGHTARLAALIAEGAEAAVGVRAVPHDVAVQSPELWDRLAAADAIVFGSPTYMGGVSAAFKSFADATSDLWERQDWQNKIAAGFTIGSRTSGDKLMSLQYMAVLAAQHGMIWVGQTINGAPPRDGVPRGENGDGAWLGLMAISDRDKSVLIPPGDAETARAFGHRIARTTTQWNNGQAGDAGA